jgi:hypothetical protein
MKKKPTPNAFAGKQYKYDRAMIEAAKKCAFHPTPISMVSNVKGFQNESNK